MLKLHIDTDLGGDIDDLCALAMVLNWPEAELFAVTTVAEHQGKRAGYARYVLRLADREDIPVAAGADVSLDCYCSWQSLPDEDIYWPEPIPPAPTPLDQALTLLERSIEQGWLCHTIDESGKPTRVVTRVHGDKFNEFWLRTVVRKNSAAPAFL